MAGNGNVPELLRGQWSATALPNGFAPWQDVHGREVPVVSSIEAPSGWKWMDD